MTQELLLSLTATRHYPAQSKILWQGDTATELYVVKTGSVRAWFNKDGVEITLQFFFEGDTVTALESFLHQVPSDIFLETIEATEVGVITRSDFQNIINERQEAKDWFYEEAVRKLLQHTHRLLSLLQHKPMIATRNCWPVTAG